MDGSEEFRISLAGAQEKTALLLWNGHWHVPHGTTPTTHILKPQIGRLPGGIDFSQLKVVLKAAGDDPKKIPEVAIQYGAFINTLIQFLIVAVVVFLLVKLVNTLRRDQAAKAPEEPAAPTPTETLLTEIRDALRQR